MTACDWCLQEALVQTVDEKLWRFWKIISTEDPIMTSHRNICDKCKSRYEEFSIYIEKCKINTSKVDELLSMGQVKDEPSVNIEYPLLIKKEISDPYCSSLSSGIFIQRQMLPVCSNSLMRSNDSMINTLSAGNVKTEALIDIEHDLINEEDIWKEEASDPDYPTASGGKQKDGLVLRHVYERQVLPDSIVLQKKVNNNLMCTYCGKTFNLPHKLKIHLCTHTGEKLYKCSHCNKTFDRSSHLNRHLHTHTGEKPFKCSHCNKSFAQSSHLNRHVRTHIDEKPYKCSQCNKSFARSSNLNLHLHTHTGEKSYKCSQCNKSFAQLSHLNLHTHTHTGENPYKCSHCNRSFGRLSTLNFHLHTHTGEKPYKCSYCNKSFAQSNNLNSHLRTHTGEKPYKCSHCNKSFAWSNNFNSHLRTHTGEKPYICLHCNKSFARSSHLNSHLRTHAGE